MLPLLLVLLLPGRSAAARGLVAQRTEESSALPTFANPEVNDLQGKAAEAVLEGLRQKGKATALRAETGAAAALTAYNQAKYLDVEGEMQVERLQDMLKRATTAGENAVHFKREAKLEAEEIKTAAKLEKEQTKKLAVQAVKKLFIRKYRGLGSWQSEALSDPYAEAKRQAQLAVTPFDQKLTQIYARMNDARAEAQALKIQSQQLLSMAAKLRAAIKGLVKTNPSGAEQDQADALQFETKGQQLMLQAQELEVNANALEQQAQEALVLRTEAGRKAMQKANPDSAPPVDFDPKMAYLPPLSILAGAPAFAPAAAPAAPAAV